jgi:hypothetical protein
MVVVPYCIIPYIVCIVYDTASLKPVNLYLLVKTTVDSCAEELGTCLVVYDVIACGPEK